MNESTPSSSGTQEQLEDFDAWKDGQGTDDDEVPDEEVSPELLDKVSEKVMTSDELQRIQDSLNNMLRNRCDPVLALTRRNQAPGVVKPEIEGNVNFEIKSLFMREFREYILSGNKNDDTHEHVERIFHIVSLFNILGVTHDADMLHVFLITLTGAAKIWMDRLPLGTINTWDFLKKAFI
ncbi:hypothetical protein Tco_1272331 [Tanacetum coccineum]